MQHPEAVGLLWILMLHAVCGCGHGDRLAHVAEWEQRAVGAAQRGAAVACCGTRPVTCQSQHMVNPGKWLVRLKQAYAWVGEAS